MDLSQVSYPAARRTQHSALRGLAALGAWWLPLLTGAALLSRVGRDDLAVSRFGHFLLAFLFEYGVAAAFLPALRLGSRPRIFVLLGLYVPLFLAPLAIASEARPLRFLAAATAVLLGAKLHDLHTGARRAGRPDAGTLLGFLANPFTLVLRRLPLERTPLPRANTRGLLSALGRLMLSTAALVGVFFVVTWSAFPFFVEHAVKAGILFVTALSWAASAVELARWLGSPARDFSDAPLKARTPAEFWRRYNRGVHQFLYEDVFSRVGGMRAPVQATLLTFALSALIHEYAFGVALGRVQGYQTVFFLLQGVAVALTMRVRPRGRAAWAGVLLTLAFNVTSSVFFFASVAAVVPFYRTPLPVWLAGW